ncbi:hypothetical protein GCM10009775_04910 [Microbacterium aoyamense]|uniref:Uncharacterized protein n=1 Tax=Microbacterium aoyamense TaxID=344166 RepID=A0ABN2P8U6_9MICO|nr:hypothetical protein [Microbacterium aoyamense]
MDLWSYIIATVILGALGLVVLYFVIKMAVRNALIDDRLFQAKVEKMRERR